MAITRVQTQVTWPTAADTKSVAAAGAEVSEEFTFDASAVDGAITVKADNASTPASGDAIDIYMLRSAGDPDADPDTTDEFDSGDTAHPIHIMRLDTNTTDPAIMTRNVPTVPQKCKFRAVNNAGTNSITVSINVEEMRAT